MPNPKDQQSTKNPQQELAALQKALAEHEKREEEYHAASMELAMGISECQQMLVELQHGN